MGVEKESCLCEGTEEKSEICINEVHCVCRGFAYVSRQHGKRKWTCGGLSRGNLVRWHVGPIARIRIVLLHSLSQREVWEMVSGLA